MERICHRHFDCLKIKVKRVLDINQVEIGSCRRKVAHLFLVPWKYRNVANSSVTIAGESLEVNVTQQFLVTMVHRHDLTRRSFGYLLVVAENIRSPIITIRFVLCFFNSFSNDRFSCVISTMCVSVDQFRYVTPSTQFALFSLCSGDCSAVEKIQWNLYQGSINSSDSTPHWTLFSPTFSSSLYGKSSLDRKIHHRRTVF